MTSDTRSEMHDVMLDIETLSSEPDGAVVSIGAVAFNPETGELGKEFYRAIEFHTERGAHVDPRTVAWWLHQDQEAQQALFDDPVHAKTALKGFREYLSEACGPKRRVWGNSHSFDCTLLRSCYKRHGLRAPWGYRDERCYRTMKELFKAQCPRPPPEGTHHNALDDARGQARHLIEIFKCARDEGLKYREAQH